MPQIKMNKCLNTLNITIKESWKHVLNNWLPFLSEFTTKPSWQCWVMSATESAAAEDKDSRSTANLTIQNSTPEPFQEEPMSRFLSMRLDLNTCFNNFSEYGGLEVSGGSSIEARLGVGQLALPYFRVEQRQH